MLIVNADDFGLRRNVTDAILRCWQAGAISSVSAMVYMADSDRSAELAREHGVPTGLHLNLTTEFTADGVPAAAARRQAAAITHFDRRLRRHLFIPGAVSLVDACVGDQLDEFARSFERGARHADGHEHIQVCPTVLLTPSLGRLSSVRGPHSFSAGERPALKRGYRAAISWLVRRRFRSPRRFLSLRDLHPQLGGRGLERQLAAAENEDIEVMVHPAWQDEREVLLSPAWRTMLAGVPVGAYSERL